MWQQTVFDKPESPQTLLAPKFGCLVRKTKLFEVCQIV